MKKEETAMNQLKKLFSVSVLSVAMVFTLNGWVAKAQSQEKYPTRSIDFIVSVVPGGSADFLARLVGDLLKKKWGVPVNVINKPGGGTVVAQVYVYKAAPDGYTVLGDGQQSSSLMEISIRDLPFKVLDRTFIAAMASSPHVFYVPSSSPFKNLKDVEAEVKRDPEHFTWGTMGGVSEYPIRQFFKPIGVDISKTKPTMCRCAGEVLTLLAGGHIKFGNGSPLTGLPHVKAGTVRAVGITGSTRFSEYPDVATTAEQGYPTVKGTYWWGISGPPKLPPDIIGKWNEALQEMIKDQEFISKLKNVGFAPFYLNSHDTKEHVMKEMEEAKQLWGLK
jgi:tripartite-type tricarboxylate transporter receptor subunit TctC